MRSLTTAWGVVVKRSAADWLILAAAMATIMLSTVLLAAGPIYVEAVTLGGLQRTLADAPVDAANVEISVRSRPDVYLQNDGLVVEEVLGTFVDTGGTIFRRALSDSYELPTQASGSITDLVLFAYYDSIEDHASIVEGAWPGGSQFEVAVSEATAGHLDLGPGDELTVTNRRDRHRTVRVTVAGIYALDDPDDSYWYGNELDLTGRSDAGSFRTFGPLIVDRETLLVSLQAVAVDVDWRVFPDYDGLAIADMSGLRGRVAGLEDRLNTATDTRFDSFRVTSQVGGILTEADRSLLVTRSGVTVLSIQLAVLAGYALFLTAGLLAESRTVEVYLLRSRGATTGQIVTMAVMEGSLLAIPAALLAPWLAAALLSILNSAGPLSSIDLTIAPVATAGSLVLSALAGAGCIAALAVPAYRSARPRADTYVEQSRQPARTFAQRAGVDVAMLLMAAVAFWQLRRYGSQITSTLDGRLGIDPLLVMAPALGLLAGAVLALRSIPTIARIADRIAGVGTSTVAALAAWQVARRPVRYARSALLLIIAISIGIFAASYTSTWTTSQSDQADFDVGADIRAASRTASPIPHLVAGAAYRGIPGVEAAMPVARQVSQLGRTPGNGAFVMLDAAAAGAVVRVRDDLSAEPFSEIMNRLVDERPVLGALPLHGEPTGIALDVAFHLEPLPDDLTVPPDFPADRLAFAPSARLVLQDAKGLLHELDLGPLPSETGSVRLEGSLLRNLPIGTTAPAYPLSLIDITFPSLMPFGIERSATIDISGVWIETGEWQPVAGFAEAGWQPTTGRLSGRAIAPSIESSPPAGAGVVSVQITSGVGRESIPLPITFSLRPAGSTLPETLPMVVSEGFLEATGTGVGDQVRLSSLTARPITGLITGSVMDFPTVDRGFAEPILIDLPTLQMMAYEPGVDIRSPNEWWLSVPEDHISLVSAALAEEPFASPLVEDRLTRARELKTNPVALGTIGALSIGFVAAVIFAAVGFAVSSFVSARERVGEYGLVRALGLSGRQLTAWLSIDHGVLAGLSLVLGTGVGLLLSWLILPLVTLTQDATAAVPPVQVVYPWRAVLWLELSVFAALAAIVATLAVLVRRIGLASVLRLGVD